MQHFYLIYITKLIFSDFLFPPHSSSVKFLFHLQILGAPRPGVGPVAALRPRPAARPPLSLGEGEVLVALVEGAAAEAGLALPLRGCSTNQFNFKLNTEIVLEYCSKALIPRCLKRITAPSFTIISHFTTTLIFNLLMMFY